MRIWKFIATLLVVGALASAAFASAAKLNLNSQGLQAGNAIVRGCQGDAEVIASYGTHYDNSISAILVDTVMVSGIVMPDCLDHTIDVVLTFGPPAICAPVCSQDLGTVPITSPTVVYSIPAGSQPSATNLTDVHVLIK